MRKQTVLQAMYPRVTSRKREECEDSHSGENQPSTVRVSDRGFVSETSGRFRRILVTELSQLPAEAITLDMSISTECSGPKTVNEEGSNESSCRQTDGIGGRFI
jgi:hypothetical protein